MTVYELKMKLDNFCDSDKVVFYIPGYGSFGLDSIARGVNEHDSLVYISPTPTSRCPYCGRAIDLVYLGGDEDEYKGECEDCKISFILKEKPWKKN